MQMGSFVPNNKDKDKITQFILDEDIIGAHWRQFTNIQNPRIIDTPYDNNGLAIVM